MTFSRPHPWMQQTLTRRRTLQLMAGAIAATSLHACTDRSPSNSGASGGSGGLKASLGVTTWIGLAPLYIAQEKGFFKAAGLDLQVKVFETVSQAFPAFTSGQVDGLAPVTSEAVTLAAQGMDFRVVLVEDTSLGADVILARNSIPNVQAFKGKKIAVELGGIGHFFLLQVLAEAGLSSKDVTLINMPPDAAAAAFQTGNVEIAYSYSPFSDKALEGQKDGRVIYSSKQMPTAIADLYTFNTQFVTSNPQAVAAFVQGHFKGLDLLKTNPQEGLAIAAKPLNLKPEELAKQLKGIQIPDLDTNLKMLGQPQSDLYLLKPMRQLAAFLQTQGQIAKTPDLSKLLEPKFVQALKQG